jgi:hypothetical protein
MLKKVLLFASLNRPLQRRHTAPRYRLLCATGTRRHDGAP